MGTETSTLTQPEQDTDTAGVESFGVTVGRYIRHIYTCLESLDARISALEKRDAATVAAGGDTDAGKAAS